MTPQSAALALPALCLLAVPTLAGLGVRRRRAKLRARFDGALGRHRPSASGTTRGLALAQETTTLLRRVGHLVGYDSAKAADYALGWIVVVPVASLLPFPLVRFLARIVGPSSLLLWPLAAGLLMRWYYRRHDRLEGMRLYRQFPEALGMIVRAVRVGVPVTESIKVVAREASQPTAREFGRLADQITIGVGLEDALREVARRAGLPEYRFFATALSLQSQTGGGLSETLDSLADTIRKRVAARERGHALASEARTTALILSGLPFVIGGLLWMIDPAYIGVLFYDRGGNLLLGMAAGSLGLGVFAMRTIIRRSLG